MFSTKNLPLEKGRSKKLSPKYIGPFTVLERLASGHAHRLEPPPQYKYIHPTFHTSLLKRYHTDTNGREKENTIPFAISKDRKQDVEKILSHRLYENDTQLLVHFRNTTPIENTWIDKDELSDHKRLIQEHFTNLFEDE